MKTTNFNLLFTKEELAQLISAMKEGNIHPSIHTTFIEKAEQAENIFSVCFCLKGEHTTADVLNIVLQLSKKVFSN
jgi:hypothetical protein